MSFVSPRRLVMISINCDFCDKPTSSDGAKVYQLSYLFGWVICDDVDCNTRMKQSMIKFYNNSMCIPLSWYTNQDNNPLCFYRKRTNMITTSITKSNCAIYENIPFEIFCKDNKLYITLQFNDDNNGEMTRMVSLINIFFHNPDFYKAICNATNLKNDIYNKDLIFDYSDLYDSIKTLLKSTYEEAISLPKGHIFDN